MHIGSAVIRVAGQLQVHSFGLAKPSVCQTAVHRPEAFRGCWLQLREEITQLALRLSWAGLAAGHCKDAESRHGFSVLGGRRGHEARPLYRLTERLAGMIHRC